VAELDHAMAKWLSTAAAAAAACSIRWRRSFVPGGGDGGENCLLWKKGEIIELGIWPPSSGEGDAFYSTVHTFAHSPSDEFACRY
jgi:hypothetical protein